MSNIEWTGKTWNPISGCSRKSDGCKNCYAEVMTKRLEAMGQEKYTGLLNEHGRFNGVIKFDEKALLKPLSVKKPTTYFVNSMSDLFHENVKDEWIDKVFAVMALTPHTYQILTKRIDRAKEYFNYEYRLQNINSAILDLPNTWFSQFIPSLPLPNVHLGVSVENQKTADERIPLLLETPAAVRFLSCEPLLEEVNLLRYLDMELPCFCGDISCNHESIDWTIVGGESGHGARPCDISWIRSIVQQCKDSGTAVFVKQLGKGRLDYGKVHIQPDSTEKGKQAGFWSYSDSKGGDIAEFPKDLQIREMPKDK